MFDSDVLDILIGLALTYAILSVICTGLTELVSQFLSQRSRTLEQGIRNLLDDDDGTGIAKEIYEHPLIRNLGLNKAGKKRSKPSYVPSRKFALALFDVISPATEDGHRSLDVLRKEVKSTDKLPDTLRQPLLALLDRGDDDLDKARKNVEEWFDDGMERVAGWYKRYAQRLTLVFALIVTVGLNADTGVIADTISKNQTTREVIVAAAERAPEVTPDVSELGVPFGWYTDGKFEPYSEGQHWYGKAIGLFLTTIAVSLGAQFWFDAVGRLIGLKSGGKPKRSDELEPGAA